MQIPPQYGDMTILSVDDAHLWRRGVQPWEQRPLTLRLKMLARAPFRV